MWEGTVIHPSIPKSGGHSTGTRVTVTETALLCLTSLLNRFSKRNSPFKQNYPASTLFFNFHLISACKGIQILNRDS